jgi:hypothetical protein
MKAEKVKSPLVEKALAYAHGIQLADARSEKPDITAGHIKAVRSQCTEWQNLTVDETATGVLICSTILDAEIWLALRDDFEPDPELPNYAIFYADEVSLLKNKTSTQLREIHAVKLAFGPRLIVRQ